MTTSALGRETLVEVGRDVDLSDPDSYASGFPHEVFRRLRAEAPVSFRPEPGGRGYWAVTRYHDVVTVLRDPATYSLWVGGTVISDLPPAFLDVLRRNMHAQEAPEHTWQRRLASKAFSARRIAEIEARIAEHAAAVVERVAPRGECDFAAEIAGEMPLFVICEILGVPPGDRGLLYGLTARIQGTLAIDAEAALADQMAAAGELLAYAGELAKQKLAAPADDLATDLLRAEVDGRKLTPHEFQSFFGLLFNAGSDTTRALLAHGMRLLLEEPARIERLRADPAGLPAAIEELLRFISPVIHFRRTATRAAVLGGQAIAAGDKVVTFFPSANRDESVFAHPDCLDLARSPNDHIAFGLGVHHCLGAPLVRAETLLVLREVLARLRDLEPAGPAVRTRSCLIDGLAHLPVRFTPSAGAGA